MFGTWRIDPRQKQGGLLDYKALSASSIHQACTNCREKKLKCSGSAGTCTRCLDQNLVCRYPEGRRRRRTQTFTKPKAVESMSTSTPAVGPPPSNEEEGEHLAKDGTSMAEDDAPMAEDGAIMTGDSALPVEESGTSDWQNWLVDPSITFDGPEGTEISCGNLDDLLGDPINLDSPAKDIQPEADVNSMTGPSQAERNGSITSLSGDHALLTSAAAYAGSPFGHFPIGTDVMGNRMTPAPTPTRSVNTKTPADSRSVVSSVSSKRALARSSRDGTKCQCLTTLACLLSRLTVQNYATEPTAVDTLIGVFKAVAREISRVAECRECNTRVEVIAVAASVTQHLVTLFENMVDELLAGNMERFQMWVGSVRIEDDAERILLCQAVVSLQFRHIDRLLETLGGLAGSSPANVRMFRSQAAIIASMKQRLENDIEASENEE